MDKETPELPPIEIPIAALSPEALDGVMEGFILREGTDYGANEVGLEAKVRQVLKQLQSGEAKLVFDPNTESVTVLTKRDFLRLTSPA